MRRSGAPSQLLGNAVKKPRFVPPFASTSLPVAESKPLAPKLGLGNALEKVNYYLQHFTYSVIPQHIDSLHPAFFKYCQILISLFFSSHPAGPEKSSSTCWE